jgi:hypothetical protein
MSKAEEMLSREGLRTLAMFIVKEIQQEVPMKNVTGPEDVARRLNAAVDFFHEMLIDAHQEMVNQGFPPQQRKAELVKMGLKIVDDQVDMLKASAAPKH